MARRVLHTDSEYGILQSSPVYLALREAIITGMFSPGARLIEEDIAAQLGTSRTPVREALRLLAAHSGLVEIVANKGAVVHQLTQRQLVEVSETRICLEKGSADLYCESGVDQEALLTQLGQIAAESRLVAVRDDPDSPGIRKLNAEFHLTVVALADNSMMVELYRQILDKLWFAWNYAPIDMNRFNATDAQHEELIDVLRKRDCASALAILDRHSRILVDGVRGQLSRVSQRTGLADLYARIRDDYSPLAKEVMPRDASH